MERLKMPIDRLEALAAAAATGSLTQGATLLGITQSAMSQRIAKLERDLGLTLLVRGRGLTVTPEGESILGYFRTLEALEREVLATVAPDDRRDQIHGVVRIAGFSSVVRSVLMPALTPMIRESDALTLHVVAEELRALPSLLRSAEAEFVALDRDPQLPGIEAVFLGKEQNVLVRSTRAHARTGWMLDHDPDDTTTERFFRHNRRKLDPRKRSFVDDIYGILEGVSLGWGDAVVSRHLLRGFADLQIVEGFRPLVTDVYLLFQRKPYYSRLHQRVRSELVARCGELLE